MGAVITAQETIPDEFNLISLGTNCSRAPTSFWACCLGKFRGSFAGRELHSPCWKPPALCCMLDGWSAANPPLPAVPMCHQVIIRDEGKNKMTLHWRGSGERGTDAAARSFGLFQSAER